MTISRRTLRTVSNAIYLRAFKPRQLFSPHQPRAQRSASPHPLLSTATSCQTWSSSCSDNLKVNYTYSVLTQFTCERSNLINSSPHIDHKFKGLPLLILHFPLLCPARRGRAVAVTISRCSDNLTVNSTYSVQRSLPVSVKTSSTLHPTSRVCLFSSFAFHCYFLPDVVEQLQ
ncbi:hypothetical protein J6590_059713 [Homalodisca vitripennis]|nr:hypothetical protein J6590_059713 [Homalodisca vitripennis]